MLDFKLESYARSDIYPFHMPGHKRQPVFAMDPYAVDITEIDGFDNLHAPEGILKEAQERAARLYGAGRSYYLVNGSTCGILAAISAAVPFGGGILMSRNAHKSVYHAAYLRHLSVEYLNPCITQTGIQGAVPVEEVRRKLKENSDICAVLVTSPTYEGVVSDIAAISAAVHEYGIPLLVDEAHGAHFGFHPAFPQTAVRLGADAVIQSMHKVLPSLTQTALLHLNSGYILPETVQKYLSVYETSSPSYVLMAGMEKCIRLLKEKGEDLFDAYAARLLKFYNETKQLKKLHVIQRKDFFGEEIFDLDPSKIVISAKHTKLDGTKLFQRLLSEFHLQMEMSCGFYALGMTSIMDRDEGFDRLCRALWKIDSDVSPAEEEEPGRLFLKLYAPKEKKLELYQAMDLPVEKIPFDQAVGRISGSMVSIYPPGIPILIPGEKIDSDFIKNIRKSILHHLNLQGIADIRNEQINVVNFEKM